MSMKGLYDMIRDDKTTMAFTSRGDVSREMWFYDMIKNSDRSPEEKKRILADMRYVGKKYGFTFREYMLFEFYRRTEEEQHEFISDKERLDLTLRLNTQAVRDLLDSKYDTYLRFKKYYKRDIERIEPGDRDKVKAFLAQYGALIAKANTDFGGYGNKVIRHGYPATPDEIADELFARFPDGFIVEELQSNHHSLKEIYPKAFNTFRIPTLRNGDKVKIFRPVLRIGAHGGEIDSALSNGGILTAVDLETGEITHARDEACHSFVTHPDTGKPIIGFRLPRWDEALELIEQMALKLDDQHYGGWDIGLTEDGWKMVEGNACGMFIWQIPLCEGFRSEFEQMVHELCLESCLQS